MKASSIYLARFCSLSWRFARWFEFVLVSILIGALGWLVEKVSAFLGPRLPQFSDVWVLIWQSGQKLLGLGKELVIVIIIVYLLVFIVAKFCGVRLIRSSRLSGNLRQMLTTTVDRIPVTDENRRDKAKNVTAEKANKAVKRSFVLARKNDVLVVVRIPKQIETRKLLIDYLDDVAADLSGQTGMTSSAWQTVSNSLTFSSYKVMQFKR